ncbi:NADPH-dependent F420 reductase [Halomonas salipaludis]|uniref:NADP oxidoreductase n=1 Tax=Halomonas salipaludis TaxID=2032625 RepID=A0A2A2EQ78_9GAMM|nr:NAD(P)-binding domain-containing protein [Halomonas salipaludis]PAU74527.1 NADP oxidoreductase [Halomonas salipaludis]
MKIGVIGAGHIGQALAKLAVAHENAVMISNSRGPETLKVLAADIGCSAGTSADAAAFGEVVILTVPFKKVFEIKSTLLEGKIVIDTNNYYPERDGRVTELDELRTTTSAMVARHFPGACVVKAFNAILAADLQIESINSFGSAKRSLPIAGDDKQAKQIVARLHHQFGFDVVDVGSLEDSWRFERAKPAYCIPLDVAGLKDAINKAERDIELPHGSWRR